MPLFSVIIPVFNAADTLPQTLESLAKQSFTDFEVIVVNDGSTDASLEVLETTTKDWEHVTIIHQENAGLGNARNNAAKAAQGTWLVFLDADDYWGSDKLLTLQRSIDEHPNTELMYHAIFERYANGSMRKRKFWTVKNLEEFIVKGNPFVPSAVAIKRNLFLKAGGFIEDRDQVEDLLLWLRLLNSKVHLLPIARPLTVYRVGVGVTGKLEDHLAKVKKAADQAVQEKLITASHLETIMTRKNYEAARQLHKLGRFEEAAGYYKKSGLETTKARWLFALNKMHIGL